MSLIQKFLLTLLVSIMVIVLGLGSLVSATVTGYVLERNSDSTAVYMTTFLEPYVQSMAGNGQLSESDMAALDAIAANTVLRRHVVSIKVWDLHGTVVFATDKDIVGNTFDTDEMEDAFDGKVVAYLDDLDAAENDFERGLAGPIFEIYVPLRSHADGSVIAVGEFYEDANRLRHDLVTLARKNWVLLTLGGLVIGAGLFAIFAQGNRTIRAQMRRLRQIESDRTMLEHEAGELAAGLATARSQLDEVDEEVRRRVGQELHDGPVQMLNYLGLAIDNLTSIYQRGEDHGQRIDTLQETTDRIRRDLRDISNRLLAPVAGQTSTLAEVVADYTARSGQPVETDNLALADALPVTRQKAIARIVEEALNNGFHHAGGQGQSVAVSVLDGALVIDVADAGPGLPSAAVLAARQAEGHHGLRGMQDQALAIGATLQFGVPDRPGYTLRIRVPVT